MPAPSSHSTRRTLLSRNSSVYLFASLLGVVILFLPLHALDADTPIRSFAETQQLLQSLRDGTAVHAQDSVVEYFGVGYWRLEDDVDHVWGTSGSLHPHNWPHWLINNPTQDEREQGAAWSNFRFYGVGGDAPTLAINPAAHSEAGTRIKDIPTGRKLWIRLESVKHRADLDRALQSSRDTLDAIAGTHAIEFLVDFEPDRQDHFVFYYRASQTYLGVTPATRERQGAAFSHNATRRGPATYLYYNPNTLDGDDIWLKDMAAWVYQRYGVAGRYTIPTQFYGKQSYTYRVGLRGKRLAGLYIRAALAILNGNKMMLEGARDAQGVYPSGE